MLTPMKKALPLFALSLALALGQSLPAFSASTDIVPRGSVLLDSFASLARANAFGADNTPEDFLGEPLYTRGQLARLLERLVTNEASRLARVEKDSAANTALHQALRDLRAETDRDGADLSVAATPPGTSSFSGYVQPELRVRASGDHQPGSGGIGVYRATAQGSLGSNLRYGVSASNWFEDRRRVFDNDKGPHDFSALSEAYLALDGGRGLTLSLGRIPNRWGSGYRGATMISDNAPPMDQIQLTFPFSLGPRLGRDYQFTQFVATFKDMGTRRYMEGRRVELAFTPRLTADFQEAFISTSSKSLKVTPIPDFYDAQSSKFLKLRGLDKDFNAFINLGLSYEASQTARLYGQLGIDDIQSPGHQSYRTPRKIAYLVGAAYQPLAGTNLVAEYSFADPTTYTSRGLNTQWQNGVHDNIGLPAGPNSQEVFVRLAQKIAPRLNVALEGRDRRRHDNSFPAPNARDYAGTIEYSPSSRSGIELAYHDYRQEAFPMPPGAVVPGDGVTIANTEGNYGQNLRIKQLDLSYRFFF